MIRAKDEKERKKERDEERGSRKEAHFLIALLCISIFYEIYSLRLSSGEFSLLGSLFVCPTVPDSSWHVHICMQQIEFHLCTDWNFSPISKAELLWRQKISLAKFNLKEADIFWVHWPEVY